MSKRKYNERSLQKLNRYFMIAKVFLASTPVIGYFYVSLRASALSITLQELLQTMPSITVIFLIAMVNAYIAYLLHLIQQKLPKGEYQFACLNMTLLLIAQVLTGNILYFLMLAWLFYYLVKTYQINLKATYKAITTKMLFTFGGGSFIVIAFSSLCLFVTLRLK